MENNLVQSNNELIIMNNELSTVNVEEMFTNTLGKETKRAYVQAIKEFFGKDLCDISIEDIMRIIFLHSLFYHLCFVLYLISIVYRSYKSPPIYLYFTI